MRRLCLLLSLLAGCKAGRVGAPGLVDAGLVDAAAPVMDPIVDLLHTVECTVAVSSKVDNPHDFPEHLVDGKPETAWNGRTGDLAGWIAFRLPAGVRVTRVELTAGFDKGDLFTKNHRITRVRLGREGVVLAEQALDPAVRGLQAIPVANAPGGDFRLEVLATVPGTEPRWRELTVSEFRVLGRAGGSPENPSHLPRMAIGSLDGVRPAVLARPGTPPPGPFPTVAALCASYDAAMTPSIDAAHPDDRYPGRIGGPHCVATKTPAPAPAGPFAEARWVRFHDVQQEEERLVVRTTAGWSRTNVILRARQHDDPGCGHGWNDVLEAPEVLQTTTADLVVVYRVVHKDFFWPDDGDGDHVHYAEDTWGCRADDHRAASCDGPLVSGRASGPLLPGPNDARGPNYALDLATVPWKTHQEPVLGPAGDLRLAP